MKKSHIMLLQMSVFFAVVRKYGVFEWVMGVGNTLVLWD